MANRSTALTALLVAPDRELAEQFLRSTARTRAMQVVSDLKSYPNAQTLEMRLRQVRPDVMLVDLATSLDAACELIRSATAGGSAVQVIGLHRSNDSEAILRSLRVGASEFLYAPFEVSVQEAAISRIQKLIQPDPPAERESGKVVVFSSMKPGSGATTLAIQTALALSRKAGQRVLLLDLDLMGGAVAAQMRLEPSWSVVDVLQHADRLDLQAWMQAVVNTSGIDVLAAPDMPWTHSIESNWVHDLFRFTRLQYDWTIVDAPSMFHRLTLMAISEAERGLLITTTELASLHLARKGVKMLAQLGFEPSRYQVLVNRVDRKNEFNASSIGKLLDTTVEQSLPNDYFSLQRAIISGQPPAPDSDIGRAIEGLAGKLCGGEEPESAKTGRRLAAVWPAWSQS